MKERVAWVTGASSGLGRHTALALSRGGYLVIAGARSFSSTENLLPNNIVCFPLNVTEADSIQCFVKKAFAQYGRIDVLVNCAGVLVLGAAEEVPPADYMRIMETNFIGMVAMIQAVLPHFRERGQGRIVNFSSLNGLMGIPFQSAYTASKHAIEGYSECLQMEVRPFGVEIMLVEPGDHRGGSHAYRAKAKPLNPSDPYLTNRTKAIHTIARDEMNGLCPDRLGDKVVKALRRKKLPFRLRIAKADQHLAVLLHRFFPIHSLFFILSHYYMGKRRN